MTGTIKILLFPVLLLLTILPANTQERVDLNLILAIDSSYSVDAEEFALQIHGTAAAFTNSLVINAIAHGKYGRIAVSVVQWSNSSSQIITVPWTVVTGQVDAYKLAIAIKSQTRQTAEGGTSISAMISKATAMLLNAPNQAERSVIDIAADGENNSGERVERMRDRTVALGITINGLSILNEVSYLNYYFQNRVIGGPGAFVQIAGSYRDFGEAILKKLLREIYGD
ncbi:MAG: DUF1194 domain-containing protein [Rhizobiaceae bacterium]|nr:DUF1194 domain-containing protein [Rhizobiaceae bacterium]